MSSPGARLRPSKRVLLIEDNPADARLFRESLGEAKGVAWEIEYTGLLASALHRLERAGIDVVALDLELPDAQGLDAVTRLRARAPEVPIVVLTGLCDEDVGIRALHEGAEDYLVKGQVGGDRLSGAFLHAIARKRGEERTLSLLSLLSATLETTSDAILILNREGRIVRFNRRFLDVWRIPPPAMGAPGESWLLPEVLAQLKDPEALRERLRELRERPEEEERGLIELTDGRVIERRSVPHHVRDEVIGRVWSFREVTERSRAEDGEPPLS